MGCSCSNQAQAHNYQQKVDELLRSVNLKEVVDQGRAAIEEAGRALDYLNRSERATALGFGAEVSSIHLDAAKRSNQRAREQAQTVLARIDDLVQQKTWAEHVRRVREAFRERGGAAKLNAFREDVRLNLLNNDSGMSAVVARLSVTVLDSAIKSAAEGDLNHIAAHLRGVMAAALSGFEAPDMGRQPVGLGLLGAEGNESDSELYAQLTELDARIERVTHRIERVYRAHPVCQKLAAVPGIGPLTATALVATVGRPQAFQNGRHLAAWLGLVPRQYSSGGKERLGGTSKRGSRYVRTLLIHGARAVVQRAVRQTDPQGRWLCALTHRKGTNVAAVALANNNGRVIWALLAHDNVYRPPA